MVSASFIHCVVPVFAFCQLPRRVVICPAGTEDVIIERPDPKGFVMTWFFLLRITEVDEPVSCRHSVWTEHTWGVILSPVLSFLQRFSSFCCRLSWLCHWSKTTENVLFGLWWGTCFYLDFCSSWLEPGVSPSSSSFLGSELNLSLCACQGSSSSFPLP